MEEIRKLPQGPSPTKNANDVATRYFLNIVKSSDAIPIKNKTLANLILNALVSMFRLDNRELKS
jgi:hypothetical protein